LDAHYASLETIKEGGTLIMKNKTGVRAGKCPSNWYKGKVKKASGGGFYGEIVGNKDGQIHYFNMGYTEFQPPNQGVTIGQTVSYAPFLPPNPRAGKVACIKS
jgi:hypothetical protein